MVLDALAIVADDGLSVALHGVEAVFVVAPEVDGGTPAVEELFAGIDVGVQRLGAFLVRADALAEGAEVVVISAGYADFGLEVLGELVEGREGFGVRHVAVAVRGEDELGELAHTLGSFGCPLREPYFSMWEMNFSPWRLAALYIPGPLMLYFSAVSLAVSPSATPLAAACAIVSRPLARRLERLRPCIPRRGRQLGGQMMP